jgi:hypothetical protein
LFLSRYNLRGETAKRKMRVHGFSMYENLGKMSLRKVGLRKMGRRFS